MSLSSPIEALVKVLRRRNVLALRSHSHDVTGSVHPILRRTEMLGNMSVSQSLIAPAKVVGQLSSDVNL